MNPSGMLTDRYELTMLRSWVTDGPRSTVRSSRRSPAGSPRAVGTGRSAGSAGCSALIEDFRFADDEVAWLHDQGVITEATADYLRDFRFTGDIDAYPEGDLYFPGSPVLTVSGTLGECVVLETLVLSVLNHDCAIACAAARMVTPPQGRPLIEMGSRRTHEEAAVAVARAAYIAGFASTSNLAAGCRYGIPTVGTAAHAFTLGPRQRGRGVPQPGRGAGHRHHAAGRHLRHRAGHPHRGRGRRPRPRRDPHRLRRPGRGVARRPGPCSTSSAPPSTRIIVTSDLDEYVIADLRRRPDRRRTASAPALVTGSGHPTAAMVYKLVAIADGPGRRAAATGGQEVGRQGIASAAARPPTASSTPTACSSVRLHARRSEQQGATGAGPRRSATASWSTARPSTAVREHAAEAIATTAGGGARRRRGRPVPHRRLDPKEHQP